MGVEYEVYVVDPVRASIWWQAPIERGTVVSRGTTDCDVANCQACGVLHGVANPETLEKHGLAARRA